MFLQAGVEGLLYGGLYALLGCGFYLTFGVLKRLNLAYGSGIMLSVYVSAMLCAWADWPWYVGLPLATTIGLACFKLIDLLTFEWIRGDPRLNMVAALGLWMAIEEVVLQGPGRGHGQPVVNPMGSAMVTVGSLELRVDYLLAFVTNALLVAALYWTLTRSNWGLKVRVVVADVDAAGLLGINVRKVTSQAQVLAGVVGVAAGYAFSMTQMAIDVHFGMWATIKGLVILVLGGVSNPLAIVSAALALGVVERLGTEFIGVGYRDLVGYGLMLLLLSAFPAGAPLSGNAAAR